MKKRIKRIKEAIVAEYRRDPEVFMQTVVYGAVATAVAVGAGLRLANGVASYRSKTAYAKMVNERYPR